MLKLLSLFRKIPPGVRPLIVELVRTVMSAPDPKRAAEKALRRAATVKAFDLAMKRELDK